jgi:hypothetical protein
LAVLLTYIHQLVMLKEGESRLAAIRTFGAAAYSNDKHAASVMPCPDRLPKTFDDVFGAGAFKRVCLVDFVYHCVYLYSL